MIGAALVLTAVVAAPVLRAPSDRLFGMAMVGRHHDPFTAMAQFARPLDIGIRWQPVTDLMGAALAQVAGPVAAYNWLVLLSFPMAAGATYLLARHLTLAPAGAALAAMAYAFAPFHMAHAAYHPHVAQTQWLPLYLLALWRCLDRASLAAITLLVGAAIAVTLSNFYMGLIAAVLTPVALFTYWSLACREGTTSRNALRLTTGGLAVAVALVLAYVVYAGREAPEVRAALAFQRSELLAFSARWWSYLIPPVGHPLFGETVRRLWTNAGVHDGLVEQQVSLGWGLIGLAGVGIWRTMASNVTSAARTRIVVLVVVGATAFACSLTPQLTLGWLTLNMPSSVLYPMFPMFRAYARFGVAVQLMTVLLAGLGVDRLRAINTHRARVACGLLVVMAVVEYAVMPSTLWRDVLPTSAHIWAREQAAPVRVLDCTAVDAESDSVRWLSGDRVRLLDDESLSDCGEPNVSLKLAARGYTHLLVRGAARDSPPFLTHVAPAGFRTVARFADSDVLEVTTDAPLVYTGAMSGFSPREYDARHTWRWMGADAAWTVVNTSATTTVSELTIELSAFYRPRRVEWWLDGVRIETLMVQTERRVYAIGPFALTAGTHELMFHPTEEATVASDLIRHGDPRPLSIAVGTWSWRAIGAGKS